MYFPKTMPLAVGLIFLAPVVYSQIQGSAHDFSGYGWSGNRVCIACHVSHNANQSIPSSPLWNREATNTVYTLYVSPTMQQPAQQPGSSSLLCLSCHDGVTATDSFGGNVGTDYIQGSALIGTDLSNDHPVGVLWDHQTDIEGTDCSNCHDLHGGVTLDIPFYDGRVECSTCHDVHNSTGNSELLRKPMTGSRLCLTCHGK